MLSRWKYSPTIGTSADARHNRCEAQSRSDGRDPLAGRTIYVSSIEDIVLKNKEVVLTFDDGPASRETARILSALRAYNVKATFLMIGRKALRYPKIAERVVADGHSVGSHTLNHPDLSDLAFTQAMDEIKAGALAVTKAADTSVGFFRFPFLADTPALRHAVTQSAMVILEVDIDSKDYFKDSPETIAARTMDALRACGSGIILFHDIHKRTAELLPMFLKQLVQEEYRVVHLVYQPPKQQDDLTAPKH